MPGYPIIIITLFLTIILPGCQAAEEPREIVRPVKTMVVPDICHIRTMIFPGKISPAREVNLSFRVSNRIEQFQVKKGQLVKSGDIIASLDTRDFEIAVRNISGRLDEARANLMAMRAGARPEDVSSLESRLEAAGTSLDEAELQYRRYSELHRAGLVATAVLDNARSSRDEARSSVRSLEMELEKALKGSREEDIEAMRARISSLEAGLDEARAALDDSVLRAPFAGYVAEKFVDDYQNITAGQPVARFQDFSRLEISVGIPEQMMVNRENIRSIHVRLELFPEHFFPARIKEISTDASAMTMTYKLTVIMDRPHDLRVYPSMAADVYVAFASDTQAGFIVVPETALVSGGERHNRIWMYDPETQSVFSRAVVPGRVTSQGVEILEGLHPGEVMVFAGADYLLEGQRVRALSVPLGR